MHSEVTNQIHGHARLNVQLWNIFDFCSTHVSAVKSMDSAVVQDLATQRGKQIHPVVVYEHKNPGVCMSLDG